MEIIAQNLGKKFRNEWIFKNLTKTFQKNNVYGIVGNNGSGKSTLLQTLSGYITPTQGSVIWTPNTMLSPHKTVAFATPYLQLNAELTVTETVKITQFLKGYINNLNFTEFIEVVNLKLHQNKLLKELSSGMLQRLKLGLCILSNANALFIDEPTANLDKNTITWFHQLAEVYFKNRLVFVCSNNQPDELLYCTEKIIMEDLKVKK